MDFLTKKRIGTALYLLTIVLLLLSVFQNWISSGNKFLETLPWASLGLASLYGIWLNKESKSLSAGEE